MNFSDIFSAEYLFDPVPNSSSGFTAYFLVLFGVLVLLSLAVKFLLKTEKSVRNMQFYCLLTTGILGLVYVFARYETLPWLASRFYLVLVLLTLVVWLVFITIKTIRYLHDKEKKKEKYEKYDKYLPNN